jgi:hypothetical protein
MVDKHCVRALQSAVQDIATAAREHLSAARGLRTEISAGVRRIFESIGGESLQINGSEFAECWEIGAHDLCGTNACGVLPKGPIKEVSDYGEKTKS